MVRASRAIGHSIPICGSKGFTYNNIISSMQIRRSSSHIALECGCEFSALNVKDLASLKCYESVCHLYPILSSSGHHHVVQALQGAA